MQTNDLAHIFLKYLRKRNYSDNTVLQYGAIARSYIEYVGERCVPNSKKEQIALFLSEAASAWSYRRALPALRALFDALIAAEKADRNPARELDQCDPPKAVTIADVRDALEIQGKRTTTSDQLLKVLVAESLDDENRKIVRNYLAQKHPFTRRLLKQVEGGAQKTTPAARKRSKRKRLI